ncbi:MAG: site-2 protease family protein [Candidatus Thorarchaeota archaeon]|nr:MAG: site-2 protease family protein [Candidatus Thorarchaeota archaeon]
MDPVTILILILGFWLALYLVTRWAGVEKLSERGVDAGTPFFLMIKTARLNAFLTRMGKKLPRAFWNVGIVVAFGGMIFGFYIFADNFLRFFTAPAQAGGVVPIIPGVTITGLPMVYMLIGLAVTLITHEFAHGLASSKDEVPIKSSGLLFFFVIFGAFVEPDEEVFENQVGPKSRMRLFAAGSYANLITAFIVFILMMNLNPIMSIAFNQPNGAYVYETVPGSPGAEALEIGDVIVGLNDTDINTWTDVILFMANATAGSQLTIHTLDGSPLAIVLTASPNNATSGYIGILGADHWEPKPGWDLFLSPLYVLHVEQILLWLWIVLVSVGLLNLLPVPALDGDRILKNALSLVTDDEKKIRYIMWPLRIASLVIVIGSIALSLYLGKGIFG